MNAALNVEVDNMPIQSWQDLYQSQYQILTVPGTFPYSKFTNAPEGSLMNKIYKEKVKTVPRHKQLGAITFEESVSVLLNEKYVAYYEMDSFTSYEEYSCQIVDLKYPEFRFVRPHITKNSVFNTIYATCFPELFLTLHFLLLKTSPFREPLMKTFNKMKSKGILDKIWQDHQSQLIIECEERKVKSHHLNC